MSSLHHAQTLRMGYNPDNALIVRRQLRGMQLDSAELVAQRRALVVAAQAPGFSRCTSGNPLRIR